jgi:hypothetical protein
LALDERGRVLAAPRRPASGVENAAVGAEPGVAQLSLGRDSGHSTVSKEWRERPDLRSLAVGTVETEVTTLGAVIEKHGVPDS